MKEYIKTELKLLAFTHALALTVCGAIALIATNVQADDLYLDVHVASKHSEDTYRHEGETKEFNEANLGLGIEKPVSSNLSLIAGGYKNSYNRASMYGGFDIHTNRYAPAGYGVAVGLITGYDETPVMALPYVRVGTRNVSVKVGVIPTKVTVITGTVSFRF